MTLRCADTRANYVGRSASASPCWRFEESAAGSAASARVPAHRRSRRQGTISCSQSVAFVCLRAGFAPFDRRGVLVAVLITYSTIMRKFSIPSSIVSQVSPKDRDRPLFVVWFGTGADLWASARIPGRVLSHDHNAAMGFQAVDEYPCMARTFMATPRCLANLALEMSALHLAGMKI